MRLLGLPSDVVEHLERHLQLFVQLGPVVNDAIIDYSTSEGSKLYKAAITKLSSETQYGCDPTNLKVFLALLKARA